MKRIHFALLAAPILIWFAACGDVLSTESKGAITLDVQVASSAQGRAIDVVRIHIVGPTNRVVNSTPGEEEVIDGLTPGNYVVALEGLLGTEVDLFGETVVTVSANQTSDANVVWDTFRPTPDDLASLIGEASFNVTFSAVDGAAAYAVEWDTDPDFGNPTIVATNTTSATITGALGIISIRVRAINEFGTIGAPSHPLMVEVAPAGSPSASRSAVVPNFTTVVASDGANVVHVAVIVLDGNDDPVANALVSLSVSGSGNTVTNPSAPTDAEGQATGSFSSTVAEGKIVSATVEGVVLLTQTASVTVTPGPPAAMEYVRGDDQVAPLLGFAPEPPTVRIVDTFQNSVPDVDVMFTQAQGDGAPETTVVSTDAEGLASTAWRMGMAEVQQLTATHPGTGTSIDFATGAYFTGTGTATIDGTIASGEWDGATCIPFAANVPGGGTVPAQLCGMNDAENLYVAVQISRNPDTQSGGAFFIDANGDGTIGPRDDYVQWNATPTSFQDWTTWDNSDDPTCPATASFCSNVDTSRGGTSDGSAAYVHDGTMGIMEMTHPLASGDALDMDFATGSRARVSLTLRTCDTPSCGDPVSTFVPGGITMRLYVQ